jgi:hypothetical protein
MLIRNATRAQILTALAMTSSTMYASNVVPIYLRAAARPRDGYAMRLGVLNKRGLGARFTIPQAPPGRCVLEDAAPRFTPNACWHVHGDFLDHLFRLVPGAVVRSHVGDGKPVRMTRNTGWLGAESLERLCACGHRPVGRADRRDYADLGSSVPSTELAGAAR